MAPGGSSIVAVAPHPDDEALGCGGTLALHAERGDSVTVVWMTAGERGIPDRDPVETAHIRRSEARAALAALGVGDGRFLDLPDGGVGAHQGPGTAALGRVLAECAPGVVFAPHRDEAHPDHSGHGGHRDRRAAAARRRQRHPAGVRGVVAGGVAPSQRGHRRRVRAQDRRGGVPPLADRTGPVRPARWRTVRVSRGDDPRVPPR